MRSTETLGLLRARGRTFISTREAAAILGQTPSTASKSLQRLADAGLIRRVRRGRWALDPAATALAYGAWVTAPLPSYVSLYTALYHRGMIQQIPRVIYVASLARTQLVETALGVYSVHQLQPALFGGYVEEDGVRMASAEKALFDTLYLGRARSGRFAALTELELPRGFDRGKVLEYARRLEHAAVRRRVTDALRALAAR